MKTLIKAALLVLLSAGFIFYVQVPADAAINASKGDACAGVGGCGTGGDVENAIKAIVNLITIIIGIVAVVMIIISGFRFITSGGDSNTITSARNGLLYALVGLVIVVLAQVIVRFVLARVI